MRALPSPKILAQWEYSKDSGGEARERSNVRQVTEHRRRDEQTFFKEEKIDSRWINVGWTRDPRRHFPVTPRGVFISHRDTLTASLLLATLYPHVTFDTRGGLASMAPLSNCPWSKHLSSSSVAVPHLRSPLSKLRWSAFLAMSSPGEASLINQRKRSLSLSAI